MGRFAADQIPNLLQHSDWAILSAELSTLSPERNAARTEVLKLWLKAKGTPYLSATGRYGGVDERSVILPRITEEEALQIARRFNQESILNHRGLVYTDGRVVAPAGPPQLVTGRAKGDRTRVNKTGVRFVIPFNFD